MTTIHARELATLTPATIQCPGWAKPRLLGCIAADGNHITIGVWPESDDTAEFDEYELGTEDIVEVTGS